VNKHMNKTSIEYLDYTWNPVTGCTPVSAGCEHCWAKRMHERGLWGKQPFSEVTLHPDRLEDPLKRKKPARIGVCFMGDLFHEKVPMGDVMQVFAVMALAPRHTFLILTKRPERMHDMLTGSGVREWVLGSAWSMLGKLPKYRHENIMNRLWPLPNVWCGVSVEDQKTADERIPWLLKTPAAVRYMSVEPMIGPVDLDRFTGCGHESGWRNCPDHLAGRADCAGIGWVICGGESGPGARPMHHDWAKSIRDQCQAAGTPFYFKQWGQFCWPEQMPEETWRRVDAQVNLAGIPDEPYGVGKKAAGRVLDGREWLEMPHETPHP
jgi:protein gp37